MSAKKGATMPEKRDLYEVLGLSKSASKDEIKSSYRKLAKKYHPDNKETGDEAKFKEVQGAYDILYDDQKRSAYDQFGFSAFESAGANPGGGNPFGGDGFGFDINDIFSFFGGGQRRSSSSSRGPTRGDDVLMRVKLDFMDAINGREIPLNISIDETCDQCHGSGARSSDDIKTCPTCRGTGYIKSQRRSIFGVVETEDTCPNCGGKGKIIANKCPTCGGKGYNRKKETIKVKIPAGINKGQQIRVQGKGERGLNGGSHGDLYVEIIVKEHDYFKRDGNDIHINIPLDIIDATLGCKLEVPTVYGKVSVMVNPGTQPNDILRMKGNGVKDLRNGKPGDQYLHFQIQVPTNLSKEQKETLEKFKKLTKPEDSLFERFKRRFKI